MLPDELDANVPLSLRKRNDSPAGDRFEPIIETPFVTPAQAPLSTFSVDVDTASYSKIRQYLTQTNSLPVPNMVRIEGDVMIAKPGGQDAGMAPAGPAPMMPPGGMPPR